MSEARRIVLDALAQYRRAPHEFSSLRALARGLAAFLGEQIQLRRVSEDMYMTDEGIVPHAEYLFSKGTRNDCPYAFWLGREGHA